jgi:hypothetical protein
MRLNHSWSTHFTAFGSSDAANANMALFGDAMDAQKSKMEKMNDLIKDNNTVALIMGKDRKMKTLHSFKNSGEQGFIPIWSSFAFSDQEREHMG